MGTPSRHAPSQEADKPLTLIDSGPNSALSLDTLERGLGRLGHRTEDLGLLLITHPHMDHNGLLDVLARRSGAPVASLAIGRPYVENFGAETRADHAFAQLLMVRHGVSPEVSEALRAPADAAAAWGSSTQIDRPLADGDTVELRDHRLEIAHRPGHSPADVVIRDVDSGIAFTGDHLIANVSSNPLLTRPLGSPLDHAGQRPRPLMDFRRSLAATRADPTSFALSGHGAPILDVPALVDRRLAGYERRAEKIAELLGEGPMTGFALCVAIWGEHVALNETYLTLSAVLAHADLLIDQGLVVEDDSEDLILFRAREGHIHPT